MQPDQLEAARGIVTVDLLDIELAHEVDCLAGDHLARHEDWKTGRIGNDEIGRYHSRAIFQPVIDFRARQTNVFTLDCIVRTVEGAPHIAFGRALASVPAV